eukprot:GHVS01034244.1.p1 GENE.GHVS01034244.1~~GHVS01034244.1.p1  ORF type:complete len:834 (+),score=163.88 GHVS01034244.1:125-2626(+)
MSKVFRAVRHIGKTAEKFRFELLVEKLSLQPATELLLAIEWIRGPKRTRSKEKVRVSSGGRQVVESFEESLLLIATLFKQTPLQRFQCKPSRLQFVDLSKDKAPQLVGEVLLDLSDYSHCTAGDYASVTLPLHRCLDPKATVTIAISCTHLGTSQEDDDAISLHSGLTSIASSDNTVLKKESSLCPPYLPSVTEFISAAPVAAPHASPLSVFPIAPPASGEPDGVISGADGADSPMSPKSEDLKIWRPTELAVHNEEPSGDLCQSGVAELMDRVQSLQTQLHDKDAQLRSLHHRKIQDVGKLEEELARERRRFSDRTSRYVKEVSSRDTKIAELLKQLEEIHTSLERSQQAQIHLNEQLGAERRLVQSMRQRPSSSNNSSQTHTTKLVPHNSRLLDSTTPPQSPQSDRGSLQPKPAIHKSPSTSAVVSLELVHGHAEERLMKGELRMAKQRAEAVGKELSSCQQILQEEREKFGAMVNDWQRQSMEHERRFAEEKKSYLESIRTQEELRWRLTNEKETELSSRMLAQKQLAEIRKQLMESKTGCNETLLSLQQEVVELTTVRDSLRRDNGSLRDSRVSELEALNESLQRMTREAQTEKQNFQVQKDALRNRIYELEDQITKLPRPSVVTKMAEQTSSLQKVAEQAMQQHSGITNRLMDLEDELIATKLSLAQSETSKDEQLVKCRQKFEDMKRKLKTYSAVVSNLEIQVTDLRLQLRHDNGGSSKQWPIRSLKSFFKQSSTTSPSCRSAAAPSYSGSGVSEEEGAAVKRRKAAKFLRSKSWLVGRTKATEERKPSVEDMNIMQSFGNNTMTEAASVEGRSEIEGVSVSVLSMS